MNFRQLSLRNPGIVGLMFLLLGGIGFAVKGSFKPSENISRSAPVVSQLSQDTALPEAETNSVLLQTDVDSTTVRDILFRSELLEQMDRWNGKALFAKLDETQSPHQFRYYYHNSLYQNTNNNALQDPGDANFFNPASLVKVPLAALTLETLTNKGLSRQAEYRVVGSDYWHRFEDDIRRALVISDNDATNRLILWLGFNRINSRFVDKGFFDLAINRLMLDQGTLVSSPAFEVRFNGVVTQQPEMSVTAEPSCYETRENIGNCASANDLVQGFMQINQPEYFPADEGFLLSPSDRAWLQSTMSHTPREEGFDYPDDYCRFLTEIENRLATNGGKMLSKCGVSLFTNTYTDLSYIETDAGQKYYILLSLKPPRREAEPNIIRYMNQVVDAVLSAPL